MNRYIRDNVKSSPPGSAFSGPWSVSASLRLRVSAVKVDHGQLQTAWVSGVARIFHSKSGYFTGDFTSNTRGCRRLRKNPLFFFFGQDVLQESGISCGLRNPGAQRVGVCRDMPRYAAQGQGGTEARKAQNVQKVSPRFTVFHEFSRILTTTGPYSQFCSAGKV